MRGAGGGGAVPPTFAVPFSFSPPFGLVPPVFGGFGFGAGLGLGFGGCFGTCDGGGGRVTTGCGWLGGSGGSVVVVVGAGSVDVCAAAPGAASAAPTTVAAIADLIRPISQGPGRRATHRRSSSG